MSCEEGAGYSGALFYFLKIHTVFKIREKNMPFYEEKRNEARNYISSSFLF